ncbi:Similar to GLYCTK: Glycerate kinase (Bos taurus) [Cotesia congregata]|uniref:Similar to GLYCTK: Glycerate kinase (Bos taurus) n=1 Tax=Cotesia congregata TaxID=51543 RepID=A0A8J2MK65_COTCN|nr:Similar to GLYCTK: Glycerate kinase (Bos taurus) [Cotesia congregata]
MTDNVYVVGFGKAVMGMAVALEELLGNRLMKGIVSIPRGSKDNFNFNILNNTVPGVINYVETSINNEPDNDTVSVTRDIIELVKSLNETDTLIVLISGGGSALLSMPKPPVTLDEKLNISRKLFNSGADIKEVNLIRQKLSVVKAGGLAFMAHPAFVIGLILSDIIDDPMELIASGPTVNNLIQVDIIEKIFIKYNLLNQLSDNLKIILFSDPIISQQGINHVKNFIIGNNLLAIENAKLECTRKKLTSVILFINIKGLITQISKMYAKLSSLICKTFYESISIENFNELIKNDPDLLLLSSKAGEIYQATKDVEEGLVLIAGGEPSVLVTGSGKGGRNQELALRFSRDWFKIAEYEKLVKLFDVVLLSVSTDGQDGPTDATGAFGYAEIYSVANELVELMKSKFLNEAEDEIMSTREFVEKEMEHVDVGKVLENNDSYNFYSRFNKGNDLVKTGLTDKFPEKNK